MRVDLEHRPAGTPHVRLHRFHVRAAAGAPQGLGEATACAADVLGVMQDAVTINRASWTPGSAGT